MQNHITVDEIQAAARQLAKSPRGQAAMEVLLEYADGPGFDLDLLDRHAFLALLGGGWAGKADAMRESIRAVLKEGGSPPGARG